MWKTHSPLIFPEIIIQLSAGNSKIPIPNGLFPLWALAFVIVVAGFGVANILITNVLEKYRDIAIMKSLGFRRDEITVIYLLQGAAVALIGAAIGCLLGFVMIQVFRSIPITPSQTGMIRSDRLQMGMSPWYFAMASGFALVVCVFASIGPSRKAARVNPVEILRGER